MKPLRLNKVIGLSIGERSLLAAEIAGGEKPAVLRLAEFIYPEGTSAAKLDQIGLALGAFLRENKFSAKHAVVGLPARWLVVKAKEVPPADTATLTNLLRLQAEGEFSTELKDLVYDYAADDTAGHPTSVLLVATSRRYVDAAVAMCDSAKLSAVMVTPSAVALGAATGRGSGAVSPLVLAVSSAGAELTAQRGSAPSAIRHLRGPGPDRPFVGELRRMILGLPSGTGINGSGVRELVLWDATGDTASESEELSKALGVRVRAGDLSALGVKAPEQSANGTGRQYAAAVALGLSAVQSEPGQVDLLHSRLAPPKTSTVPLWAVLSGVAAILLIALCVWAYIDMGHRQAQVDALNATLAKDADRVKQAQAIVDTVSFAQGWQGGNPRFLACMRDLTNAVPQDGQTYATTLEMHELVPQPSNNPNSGASQKPQTSRLIDVKLSGKTSDQKQVAKLVETLKSRTSVFRDVKFEGTQNNVGRNGGVSFDIRFTYIPPKQVQ